MVLLFAVILPFPSFPFATLETFAGFLRGSGTAATSRAETEPVAKAESGVGEDLLTLMTLPLADASDPC